jgi:hypothetical protein
MEVVCTDGDHLSRIGRDLDDIGLERGDEDLIRNEYTRPSLRFTPDTIVDNNWTYIPADAHTGAVFFGKQDSNPVIYPSSGLSRR